MLNVSDLAQDRQQKEGQPQLPLNSTEQRHAEYKVHQVDVRSHRND